MKTEGLCTFLSQNALFQDLNKDRCREIGQGGKIHTYLRGDSVTIDSSESTLLVVLEGELSAVKVGDGGETTTVIGYTTGQFLEARHLVHSQRADQVIAQSDTQVLVLSTSVLQEVTVSFLSRLAVFGDLSESQVEAIAGETFLECYNEGELLFLQDEIAGSLYIVVDGQVGMIRVYEEDEGVVEDEIRAYERGEAFGERGLLMDRPRAASGKVKERAALLVLSADKFQELGSRYPEITLSVYRYLVYLLDDQASSFWRAARDLEKMKTLIQSTKMAALGQLVAGIAHEINTPVGTISSDATQLGEILAEAKETYEGLSGAIDDFSQDRHLDVIAGELGYDLDDPTRALAQRYAADLGTAIEDYYQDLEMTMLFEDMQEISGELNEAANRIRDMVRSLASFARLDEAELKDADVHEGLDATLALLRHELKYQVVVEKEYDLDLPEITCYPNQLNQVFMNILMNAIQALDLEHLPEGEKGHIGVKTYREGRWLVVAIRDSGKGIDPDNRDKIFEPFFSTKGAAAAAGGLGLGLGLSISQKIVQEKHFGEIDFDSELGKGTTFFVRLPLERSLTATHG